MSPLFGGHDDDQATGDVEAMSAEIARLEGLTLSQLAAEVMTKGFGPDGPGGPGRPGTIEDLETNTYARVGATEIARLMTPAFGARAVGGDLIRRLTNVVAEGLQVLENAALVRASWNGGQPHYMATRLGRAVVSEGRVEQALSRPAG